MSEPLATDEHFYPTFCGGGHLVGCILTEWHSADYIHQEAEINRLFDQGHISADLRDEALQAYGPIHGPYNTYVSTCLQPHWTPLERLYAELTKPRWTHRRRILSFLWLARLARLESALVGAVSPYWASRPVPRRMRKVLRERKEASYNRRCRHRLSEYFAALDDILMYVTPPDDVLDYLRRSGVSTFGADFNWESERLRDERINEFIDSVFPTPRRSATDEKYFAGFYHRHDASEA